MAKRQRIEIKSAYDLEDLMSDMFHDFLESLGKKKGMKRKPNRNYDGWFADDVSFIYTDKAMNIIGRYQNRMHILFNKHYPLINLCLKSSLFITP